jgi:hypothetical protein
MIGAGGLVLVVSHLFDVPISILLVVLQKTKQLNLDVKNIFAGSHTEHR